MISANTTHFRASKNAPLASTFLTKTSVLNPAYFNFSTSHKILFFTKTKPAPTVSNTGTPNLNCHRPSSYIVYERECTSNFSTSPSPVRIVHLCRRRSDGAFVILKEIPVEQMSRDERLAAQNECQVLKLLNHPNIIEYYENFLEDKALMIAMEYAPGKITVISYYITALLFSV